MAEQPVWEVRVLADGLFDPREVYQAPSEGALMDFNEESDIGDSTAARVVGEGATGADEEEAKSDEEGAEESSDDEVATEDPDTPNPNRHLPEAYTRGVELGFYVESQPGDSIAVRVESSIIFLDNYST